MFCTNCGRELEEGARFCPGCGSPAVAGAEQGAAADAGTTAERGAAAAGRAASPSPAAGASGTAGAGGPVAGQAPAPAPRPRRRGRVVAIVVAAALVVAAIVGVVAWQLLSRADEPARASFGQEEVVALAARTRVVPRDAAGEAWDAYTVALLPAGDDDASVDEAPYVLEVEGTDGFTLSDFGEEVPDGAYTLVVTPAGDSGDGGDDATGDADDRDATGDLRLPVELTSDDAEAPAEVVVTPPATGSDEAGSDEPADERARAYAAYLEKCEEYEEAYGEPSAETLSDGSGFRVARGLAVVRLVDFDGDGTDELLLAYSDQDLASANEVGDAYEDSWHVEVWAYSDGDLERVYDEPNTVTHSNGGSLFLSVYEGEDARPLLGTQEFGASGESMAFYGYADGSFDVLLEAEVQYPSAEGSAQPRYLLDGSEVTSDEYFANPLVSQFGTAETYFVVDWPGIASSQERLHDVEDTVSLTQEALAELEDGAAA